MTSRPFPRPYFFFGSGAFAAEVLRALADRGIPPSVVYTLPDRPRGRGRRLSPTPVKEQALLRSLACLQPDDLLREETVLPEGNLPRLVVVTDYGKIIPPALLDRLPGRWINLHPSLLPRYRGAAPIIRAIMAGERETGVTLMLMDEGLDTGPVIAQEPTAVGEEEDAGGLSARLADLGAELLLQRLPAYLAGEIRPRPQRKEEATYAPPLLKEERIIDWRKSRRSIHNLVRALSPSPGAYTFFRGKRLKILRTRIPEEGPGEEKPGVLSVSAKGKLAATAADGPLELLLVQPEGKRVMQAADFIRGYRPRGEPLSPHASG